MIEYTRILLQYMSYIILYREAISRKVFLFLQLFYHLTSSQFLKTNSIQDINFDQKHQDILFLSFCAKRYTSLQIIMNFEIRILHLKKFIKDLYEIIYDPIQNLGKFVGSILSYFQKFLPSFLNLNVVYWLSIYNIYYYYLGQGVSKN